MIGLEALITTLIGTGVPVLVNAIRGLIGRWTGGAGAEAQSVEERIKLMEAETAKSLALAKLDDAAGASRWVIDFRSLTRPVLAVGVAGTMLYLRATGQAVDEFHARLTELVIGYWFGERIRVPGGRPS
jgi:hypothetical protein